jgi:hypothetical protein
MLQSDVSLLPSVWRMGDTANGEWHQKNKWKLLKIFIFF